MSNPFTEEREYLGGIEEVESAPILVCAKHCEHDLRFYRLNEDPHAAEENKIGPMCWHEDEDGFCGHRCTFPAVEVARHEYIQTQLHENSPCAWADHPDAVSDARYYCGQHRSAPIHSPVESPPTLGEEGESVCAVCHLSWDGCTCGGSVFSTTGEEDDLAARIARRLMGNADVLCAASQTNDKGVEKELATIVREDLITRAPVPPSASQQAADELALVLKWMRDNAPVTVGQIAEVLRNREGVNRIEAARESRIKDLLA